MRCVQPSLSLHQRGSGGAHLKGELQRRQQQPPRQQQQQQQALLRRVHQGSLGGRRWRCRASGGDNGASSSGSGSSVAGQRQLEDSGNGAAAAASASAQQPSMFPGGAQAKGAVATSRPAPSFDEVMAFDGVPEAVNGRLAMLGLVIGVAIELRYGVSVVDQLGDPNQYGVSTFAMAALLVTAASVVPCLKKGLDYEPSFGPFTREAEKSNGRLAMLAFAFLYLIEYVGGVLVSQS